MTTLRVLAVAVIFSASGAAQNPPPTLTTLYNFTGGSDGGNPSAPLVIGDGGVLYGPTQTYGFEYYTGVVFSLTPPVSAGDAWTETVLHSFRNYPNTRLAIGSGGVIYGATYDTAVIFSLTPPPSPGGQWTESVIYTLPEYCCDDDSAVALGPSGGLYDTALTPPTVFALAPPASSGDAWTKRVLYTFPDGSGPYAFGGVVIGAGGVLYGMTQGANCGTLFSLTPPTSLGGPWTESTLYAFQGGSDGCGPASLVIGSGGVLYGTTSSGGSSNAGTVYSLTPPASPGGSWTEAVLHEFSSVSGRYPEPGPLTIGETGTLYGTTRSGGASSSGTAFALQPPNTPGGPWTEILLHTFTGSDGTNPTGLAIGSGGVLYGATYGGGTDGYGTVFALAL
jgi:uncharacterized repeat protein (TIGR03803 family)